MDTKFKKGDPVVFFKIMYEHEWEYEMKKDYLYQPGVVVGVCHVGKGNDQVLYDVRFDNGQTWCFYEKQLIRNRNARSE